MGIGLLHQLVLYLWQFDVHEKCCGSFLLYLIFVVNFPARQASWLRSTPYGDRFSLNTAVQNTTYYKVNCKICITFLSMIQRIYQTIDICMFLTMFYNNKRTLIYAEKTRRVVYYHSIIPEYYLALTISFQKHFCFSVWI